MNYQREREDFIVAMAREGMPASVARLIMRHANTVQRLAVAECNGDWSCDNGERKVEFCGPCGAGYVESAMRGKGPARMCQSCATGARLKALLSECHGFAVAELGGDPRGACVKLRVPSGKTDDGGKIGICVPTRRY